MSDNDSGWGGFLGLLTLGATAVLAYKSGEKKVYKRMNDEQRDNEIAELKRQVAMLTCKKPSEFIG